LEANDDEVFLIVAGLASYMQLRWRDERQCNNQPVKRHKMGAELVVSAESGGTMAQLVVSASQLLKWQQQQQRQQQQ
jgi:hypothetical protein